MPRIELVTQISAPVEKVFDISRSIDVHQESQARNREKAIAGRTSGLIEEGDEVTWEATHFGVRQHLTSRIAAMKRPVHFRDSMVKGAFKRLDHDHNFETDSDGQTRMIDVFDYTSPLGFLGRIADVIFLERYMRRLLEERNAFIKRTAESSANFGLFGESLQHGSDGTLRRRNRILLNLLLPPGVAATLLLLAGMILQYAKSKTFPTVMTLDPLANALVISLYVGAVAYFYAIIPSAICTGIMEWFYRKRGLSPESRTALVASALCGVLAGGMLSALFLLGSHGTGRRRAFLIMTTLGGITGVVTGAVVKAAAKRARVRARSNQGPLVRITSTTPY